MNFSGPLWVHMSGRVFQVWVFHFLSWKFQLQGTFVTNKKVEYTHAHHYLEFQEGWCLAFITKLVEQTQPKSMKSVQFHPSPPTWKQTPKNTKNNHPKHSRPKKHDEIKRASTPHQTKIPFILTQLNILPGRVQKKNFPSLCSDLLRHPRHFFAMIEAQR